MTFVSRVGYDAHDTFEHAAVIRPPLEVDKSLNCVSAMAALPHNLGFALIVDPYRYRSIHGPVKAVIKFEPMSFRAIKFHLR